MLHSTITPNQLLLLKNTPAMLNQSNDNRPLFFQLIELIKDRILSGKLSEGESLPSVRQLSQDFSINPQTVLKATQVLVQENIIEKRRGIGMFIKTGAFNTLVSINKQKFSEHELVELVQRAKLLNISQEQLLSLISSVFEDEK